MFVYSKLFWRSFRAMRQRTVSWKVEVSPAKARWVSAQLLKAN